MKVFLKRVNETIRYSMARSAEVAYDYLEIKGALELFHLNTLGELQSFIREQQEKGRENGQIWILKDNKLFFKNIEERKRKLDPIPTL